MTERELVLLPHDSSAERIRIGANHRRPVVLGRINELEQVRHTYNPAAISELAQSLVTRPLDEITPALSDEELRKLFVLLHQVTVGHFTDTQAAQKYIDDHAEFYGIEPVDAARDLLWGEDGTADILIAGHRRRRASELVAQLAGRSSDWFEMESNSLDNPEFGAAIGLQMRENVYERPPVVEEARGIRLHTEYLARQTNRWPTIHEVAADLGMKDDKVADALAFTSLPPEIQAYTNDGLLSYTVVRSLKRLEAAYEKLYGAKVEAGHKLEETKDQYVLAHLVIFANTLVSKKLGARVDSADERVDAKVKEILGLADYQTGELFIFEDARSHERRDRSSAMLSDLAVKVLLHQAATGQLSPELVERLRGIRVPSQPQNEPSDEPDLFAAG